MIYNYHNTAALGRKTKISVNGNEIDFVVSADTVKGEVIYLPKPVRVKKNSDEIYTRKLRGKVTVEFIEN